MRRVLALLLAEDGHTIVQAEGAQQALRFLSQEMFDVVLTDHRMPDGKGLDVIDACTDVSPYLPVIMITSFASIDLAVDAMRHGAFDFIAKPFEPDAVRAAVRRAIDHCKVQRENSLLRSEVHRIKSGGDEFLGTSAPIRCLREQIVRVAPTDTTVLILGETGTGKELVSRTIHAMSLRAQMPFIAVNCAAMPESLLESILFGHEKGAFTGANQAKQGLFEAAHGGSLFLDEIGEMPFALQAKLLRFFTNGEVLRVGAHTPRHVDVRLLLATNRNLEDMVKTGGFRQDLYYRIAVVPLTVPPLRDRRDDIPGLVEHFLRIVRTELNLPVRSITPSALAALQAYSFAGNVRELRNLIERAYILGSGDEITLEDLPIPQAAGEDGEAPASEPPEGEINLREYIDRTERTIVERTLRECAGNQSEAARRLCLSRSDMNYRVRKFGLHGVR
ncbi:MAG: sigma-54-dependent Fis family transcriptional regulator [Candidatus Hydrogenedentes bacterium]|nr:sigma-54-dependent Fis family transcriptional regulator [Candidatus Hydrogenedentota bacterium]